MDSAQGGKHGGEVVVSSAAGLVGVPSQLLLLRRTEGVGGVGAGGDGAVGGGECIDHGDVHTACAAEAARLRDHGIARALSEFPSVTLLLEQYLNCARHGVRQLLHSQLLSVEPRRFHLNGCVGAVARVRRCFARKSFFFNF